MLWDRCFIKEYIRKEGPGLKLEISGPFPTKEKDGNLKLPMQVYIEYPYIYNKIVIDLFGLLQQWG